VIDCPEVLSTGATILLNVRVYLTRQAFVKVEKDGRGENGTFWQEQQETVEEEAMRKRKDALGLLFSECTYLDFALTTGRIGVKPIQSNALLMAQKKNGQAAEINHDSLQHFPTSGPPSSTNARKRSISPSKRSASSGDRTKGKASAKNSDNEDEEDSGDEAEKLDEKQLNEIDSIYRK
jgi:DNA repair protein RAD5